MTSKPNGISKVTFLAKVAFLWRSSVYSWKILIMSNRAFYKEFFAHPPSSATSLRPPNFQKLVATIHPNVDLSINYKYLALVYVCLHFTVTFYNAMIVTIAKYSINCRNAHANSNLLTSINIKNCSKELVNSIK